MVGIAYYSILHYGWGQTFGKRLAGVQLTAADGSTIASRSQIIRRAVFMGVLQLAQFTLSELVPFGGLLGLVFLLDLAWILWDGRREAIHDKVAGTVLVRAVPGVGNPYGGRRFRHRTPGPRPATTPEL